VFDPTGSQAFLFSEEPRELLITSPGRHEERELSSHEPPTVIRARYERTYSAVESVFRRRRPIRREYKEEHSAFRMPNQIPSFVSSSDDGSVVKALAELLSRYLGASWIVVTRQQ
jgi:hypothetical protein